MHIIATKACNIVHYGMYVCYYANVVASIFLNFIYNDLQLKD